MDRKRSIPLVLLGWTALVPAMNGCSLVGLGIGAGVDATAKKEVPGWQVITVEPGTSIEVIRKDGRHVRGTFAGLGREPAEVYAQRVAEAASAGALPAPGDPVTVVTRSEMEHEGVFVGFDRPPFAFAADSAARGLTLELSGPGTEANVGVPLTDVSLVRSGDREFRGATLRELDAAGGIPALPALILRGGRIPAETVTDSTATAVALDDVDRIRVPRKTHQGMLMGFLVGAVVDAIIVATYEYDMGTWDCDSSASCPFVYSFDGERWTVDSETFGGALFEAARRTDWDNLDHLREVQGVYQLALANELEETQYVDELKLLVVDHPPGTRVVPSFTGSPHTVSAPVGPSSAVAAGADVRELVAARDDQAWIGNPFGLDPDSDAGARTTLELAFPRPPGAQRVKLVANVRNTAWASYLQRRLLALHGRELDAWYAHMNQSAAARQALREAMIREGMLVVTLWNGETWQKAGFVWEVGPRVDKDVAVELDLREVRGESLRVRLESTAGFWAVNSAEVDYSTDLPVQVTVLSADEAVDRQGNDLRASLRETDGRYYVMPDRRDRATLRFVAPPLRVGMSRSWVLESTGYYTIRVAGDGEPQEALLAEVMTVRGAWGRYTLQVLDEFLAAAWPGSARR